MTRTEQIAQALDMLSDDELFIECVNELDSWNGFADGFRCYDMCEIDDLYGDMRLSDFLDLLTGNFSHTDSYFYHTIYGLESTDYIIDVYRDHTDEHEVLDALLDNWPHMDIYGADDFCDLMDDIYNEEGTDDEESDGWIDEE